MQCCLPRAAAGVVCVAAMAVFAKPVAPDPPYAFARGWANLMAGWLELPRGIVYENSRIPVVGFVAGPVKGSFLATWRELAGAMDVVCFGLTRKGLYTTEVPEFVWDATWVPVFPDTPPLPGRGMKKPAAARPAHRPAPMPEPAACPPRTQMPGQPAAVGANACGGSTVTATVCVVSSAVQASPAHTASRAGTPGSFDLSGDGGLGARIDAIEQKVRSIERRAAVYK